MLPLDRVPPLPTREFVADLYRAVLAHALAREDAAQVMRSTWWPREEEWEDDEVLCDAVEGVGFLDLRHGPGDHYMYPDEQIAGWLQMLEDNQPYDGT